MSQMGHKQTQCVHGALSALPPKADIANLARHVRFVPKADSYTGANRALFDHRVWTISRTDPTHEVGHGVANLVGAILLQEMAPFHRHFGLVQPGAAKFPLPADQNRTWIGIDEQLRDLGRGEPSAIVFDHLHHIRGVTFNRNHSWPCERGPAVLARSNEGLTVSGHFSLTELAYDGVRQHSFNKHVLFKNHLLAAFRSEALKHTSCILRPIGPSKRRDDRFHVNDALHSVAIL